MKNTSVLSAFNIKGHKGLMADVMLVVYTCCHFFPLCLTDKSLNEKEHGKSIGLSQDTDYEIPTEEQ